MGRLLALLMALCFVVGPAVAQDCSIAAYADPAGTNSFLDIWTPPTVVTFHVVMFVENTAAAVAYSMELPVRYYFEVGRWSGPSGRGLVLDEPTGTNVALAECVIGFGGHAVLVDTYELYIFDDWCGPLIIGPNTSQDPDLPQYVTCNDIQLDCEEGRRAWGCTPLPSDAKSFGAIKSLYHKD